MIFLVGLQALNILSQGTTLDYIPKQGVRIRIMRCTEWDIMHVAPAGIEGLSPHESHSSQHTVASESIRLYSGTAMNRRGDTIGKKDLHLRQAVDEGLFFPMVMIMLNIPCKKVSPRL